MPALEETIAIVKEKHRGQTDKAGRPYWEHPVRVMARCRQLADAGLCSEAALHAALLHDVLEDADVPEDELGRRFGPDVLAAVRLCTRPAGMPYMDFVRRILDSGCRDAVCVKWCDLQDNANPARLAQLAPEQARSLGKRYARALALFRERAPWLETVQDADAGQTPAPLP